MQEKRQPGLAYLLPLLVVICAVAYYVFYIQVDPDQEPVEPFAAITVGNEYTHAVIKRTVDRIIAAVKHSAKNKDAWPEERREALYNHMLELMNLIETHHEQEEKDMWNQLAEHMTGLKDKLPSLRQEHKDLKAAITAARKTKLSANAEEAMEQVQDATKAVWAVLEKHTTHEEATISQADVLKQVPASVRESIIKNLVKTAKESDKTGAQLPLMYYSQTEEERGLMFKKMPWFVKNIILKYVYWNKYKNYAEFYPFHSSTADFSV